MIRTVQIEDTLSDIVEAVCEDVQDVLMRYLKDNPDTTRVPDLGNDLDYSGEIHEIVDGSVPVYTREINDIFYLHRVDVEAAFDNAGVGSREDWPSGDWRMAAIYCYLDARVRDWYQSAAEDIFDTWQASTMNPNHKGEAA